MHYQFEVEFFPHHEHFTHVNSKTPLTMTLYYEWLHNQSRTKTVLPILPLLNRFFLGHPYESLTHQNSCILPKWSTLHFWLGLIYHYKRHLITYFNLKLCLKVNFKEMWRTFYFISLFVHFFPFKRKCCL